jgi:pimeloyl-ACP methyl ester carboxylesterase
MLCNHHLWTISIVFSWLIVSGMSFSSLSGGARTMAAAASATSQHECATTSDITHLIVLVHGWMGNAQEMDYIKSSLEREGERYPSHKFVVVSPTVNEGRTHDGIAAGGDRLAANVSQLIEQYQNEHSITTLSFVGNSLGGLYSRYAIAKLPLGEKVEPLVFCSTATPHLGVSSHTYVPLPKWGEWVVGNVLRPTGRDLFSLTSTVQDLAFDPAYREPLQQFQKRIAYANAFATDFQVPTCTAAFLCPSSPHLHKTVGEPEKYFPLTVETAPDPSITNHANMAHVLDTMGWTKVFCDMRENIPLPTLPVPFFSNPADMIPQRQEYTAEELIPMVTQVGPRVTFPLGHQVLVANSKSGWYTTMSAGGRPVVDRIATNLIDDIVKYSTQLVKEQEVYCT